MYVIHIMNTDCLWYVDYNESFGTIYDLSQGQKNILYDI